MPLCSFTSSNTVDCSIRERRRRIRSGFAYPIYARFWPETGSFTERTRLTRSPPSPPHTSSIFSLTAQGPFSAFSASSFSWAISSMETFVTLFIAFPLPQKDYGNHGKNCTNCTGNIHGANGYEAGQVETYQYKKQKQGQPEKPQPNARLLSDHFISSTALRAASRQHFRQSWSCGHVPQ